MADAEAPSGVRSVRVSTGWSLPSPDPDGPDLTGGAHPVAWLGARPVGGLTLPDAKPTAHQMYGPRGVWLDAERLVVADTGNHRLMIWHDPDALEDHRPADVVLGQPNATTEGPQAGGRGPANGLHLPTGIAVHEGRLVVADAWNHRLLVWNRVPAVSDTPPDLVIGQPDAVSVAENRGGPCAATGFYWPFGLAMVDGRLWVADTGNRRLVAFDGIPEPDQVPCLVLGQRTPTERDENRGELGADSFRWPHDLAGHAGRLYVADAGNHRLLGWSSVPDADGPADLVLGQPDFESAVEIPYAPQSGATLRFPYAVAIDDHVPPGPDGRATMAVADTANNRILVWDAPPTHSGTPADRVIGQPDFASIGENRWDAVRHDTLCWPYGLALHRDRLAVADSGNNRVMVWSLS